jgi:site-specific DNA recombinase
MTNPSPPVVIRSPRAAIYARFSSDNQSDASIDDQVRVCRARADREGWRVVAVYADYAISGASAHRPQFQALLGDARLGKIDIVLAEAMDRLSRDQEHIAGFYKHVIFAGARIVTIAEGDISELHIGLKGTMSALFLKDLALKTHRGIEGRVRAGHSGGGLSFGYRVVRRIVANGMPTSGEMELADDQALVVRRVFAAYVGGQSPRAIAKSLNAEHVAGPRGGRWTASLILGNDQRETGVLRNRLYVGERVWNRQHFVKNPTTGKRVARPNPREAWVVNSVPALRIIDEDIWHSAQARLAAGRRRIVASSSPEGANVDDRANWGGRLVSARRPVWPLSGLVRCGLCGGPMGVVANDGRLGCSNHRERGTCSNKRTMLRARLLDRVLVGLKERLLTPDLVEAFVETYVAEVNAANRDRGHHGKQLGLEAAKLSRQMRNMLELIKDGMGSRTMVAELRVLEDRHAALTAEMAAAGTPEPMPLLHPNLPAYYRRKIEGVERALENPTTAAGAVEALRSVIDAIMVFPGEKRGEVTVQLRGDLAAFMHLDDGAQTGTAAPQTKNGCFLEVVGTLVAGIGFEPMTFRL